MKQKLALSLAAMLLPLSAAAAIEPAAEASAEPRALGVETRGISRLDKFGTLIVRGERCQLTSFVTSAPPPSKKDSKAAEEAQEAAPN